MRNILRELYHELTNISIEDEKSYYREYCKLMDRIIECAVISDSILIKELLIEEVKNKDNFNFPTWLFLVLLKIYVLQNPNDIEMYELAILKFSMHLAIEDTAEVKTLLTVNFNR